MEVRRYLELSEKLNRLMEEAESEAKEIMVQAERESERMIAEARERVRELKPITQDDDSIKAMVEDEERKGEEEAAKISAKYEERLKSLRAIPEQRYKAAVDLVLRRVLPT